MANEKRFTRGYKVRPSIYKKAMARAKKEKGKLANLVENAVICYAYGMDIQAKSRIQETFTELLPVPDEPIRQ